MRLKVTQSPVNVHADLVGALGWNVWNELFSCSDDQTVQKWSMVGEPENKVCSLDAYCTDLHWYPVSSKKNQAGGTDIFAVSCTDGSFKIISRTGRLERSVDAHRGAVVSLRWSFDGTALATAGEDGQIKIWSRNGMLRSTLSQAESPVYALVWAADGDQLCYCSGSFVVLQSTQVSARQTRWKAHEGVVLKVDWSPINNLIVTGGEDCKYKVWDIFGRLLYQSAPLDYSVTTVAWSASGDLFAVGSFNALYLCDRMGWSHSKAHTRTGSILSITWTSDGTQLAGAGGSGAVVFGQVVDITFEDGRVRVNLQDDQKIVVQDLVSETSDELDFRDRVVKMSLGFEHLVVATSTQCHIYSTSNWNTPHIFDLKDTVHVIIQCERCFLMADNATGIQVYTYEGRQVCNPKFQGLRTELLNQYIMSVSNDTLAVLDQTAQGGGTSVRFFDMSGRPIGEPFTHVMEVRHVSLSQSGTAPSRHLTIIDRNRDLVLASVAKKTSAKLASMVDSVAWHDTTGMLAGIVDQKLCVWYYPNEVFVDKELLNRTKWVKSDSDFGKAAQIVSFTGAKVLVRRGDGVLVTAATSPHPLMLYSLLQKNDWDKATRLCRFIKDPSMWATLAAAAMAAKELNTAETAFAAIDEVDKLHYVIKVKQIPTEEGRNAALALYRRKAQEAEDILVQAGLIYRAIKMNIKLFKWDRALKLAEMHKTHVETVLWYRSKYMAATKQTETESQFMLSPGEAFDEKSIKQKIQEEKVKEAQRPGALPYV